MTPQEKRDAWRRRKGLLLVGTVVDEVVAEPTPEAIRQELEFEAQRARAHEVVLRQSRLKRYKRLSLEHRGVRVLP